MSRAAKTLEKVLRGNADANIAFDDLTGLLRALGFSERVKGSHHIFTRGDVTAIVNLQPKDGKAKAYQVKQVRELLIENGLADDPDDEDATGEEDADDA